MAYGGTGSPKKEAYFILYLRTYLALLGVAGRLHTSLMEYGVMLVTRTSVGGGGGTEGRSRSVVPKRYKPKLTLELFHFFP